MPKRPFTESLREATAGFKGIKAMSDTKHKPVKVFLSYSHKDEQFADRLQQHLAPLKRDGIIETWFDREIEPGSDWTTAIDEHLKEADLILLLVSADFIASEYCYGTEVRRALAMHDAGEAAVVPIILRPCDWASTPFSKLQALPRDAKPISTSSNVDEALMETAQTLRRIASSVEPSGKREEEVAFEIRLDARFDDFSEEKKKRLLEALRAVVGKDVKLVTIKKGSVILRLKLPRNEIERLQQAASSGVLGEFNILEAEVITDPDENLGSDATRPRVFIGSSKEGLEVAETIQLNLDDQCEVTIWTQGHFALGSTTLETLVRKLDEFDYAILVLTPDDLIESRGDALLSPRDNVIFELGLFMGHLGRDRTIIVYDRTSDLKIPTDLAGVTAATFQPHTSGNLDAALGAPCTRLKKHIRSLGSRRA
jgi:predicted nucleotide-binding protein